MNTAYLSLGSNLGNRHQNLVDVLSHIENYAGHVKEKSSVYETAPWGNEKQPNYLNQVISIETNLNPVSLLHELLAVERLVGRDRNKDEKWGPRVIDIDILIFDDQIVKLPEIKVPHPKMHQRMFVLTPFAEIAPKLKHPTLNKTIIQLKNECKDPLLVSAPTKV